MNSPAVTPGMEAAEWLEKLEFVALNSEDRFKLQDDQNNSSPAIIIHMVDGCNTNDSSSTNQLKRSVHQLIRIIRYKTVIVCAQSTDFWQHFFQEFQNAYPDICFYINQKVRNLEPPHTDKIKLYFYSGKILLHFFIHIQIDSQTGTNVYSEDPNDPATKP